MTAIGRAKNRDKRRTQVKEENDDHETDDDGFFEQIAFQRVDRFLNQSRTVIPGDDFDSRAAESFESERAFA